MDAEICKTFTPLTNSISYLDNVVSYQFTTDEDYNGYCTGGNCNDDTDKMNARCLHIFDALFKDKSTFEKDAKGNIYIVQYILIWLSYVLSLIKSEEKGSLNEFYNTYINGGEKYNKNIDDATGYKNYKDLIDRYYYLLSMDMSIISKLYDAFSTLCDMYIEFETNSNCDNYLEKRKNKKYKEENESLIYDSKRVTISGNFYVVDPILGLGLIKLIICIICFNLNHILITEQYNNIIYQISFYVKVLINIDRNSINILHLKSLKDKI
ncbi:hypothetical protein YYC_04805 [Plasmodium yoelii 17X]|uniref:Uncharacterized protein n=1 Tax=Plasmodium yoelii 17X TaxID=1323249 RepID=V7PEW9_PLAYE|nr:hypothetical protein YYC_04805 [Plasmodium yoelii 17X]